MVALAGLAITAGSCGNLSDPLSTTSDHYQASAVAVRYGSDGRLVVYATSVIDTYGPDLAQPLVHVSLPTSNSAAFTISDDGRVAAVGAAVGLGTAPLLVQLIDLSTGQLTSAIPLAQPPGGYTSEVQGVTLSRAGDLLFVVGGLGTSVGAQPVTGQMFDTSSGAQLWAINATGPGAVEASFSSDASTLYTLGTSQYPHGLQKIDSRTGTIGFDAPLADAMQTFGGMSDPETLIGVAICDYGVPGSECTAIDLLSTSDGSVTRQIPMANTEFGGTLVQPPAFACAVGVGLCVVPVALETDPNASALTQAVQVWSLDGTLVQTLDEPVGDAAISPDGQSVALTLNGDVAVYRVSDGSQIKLIPYRNRPL